MAVEQTSTRPPLFPAWPRGPKPKRRTELGLLIFASVIITAIYTITELGVHSKLPSNIGTFFALVFGFSLLAHLGNRWLAPRSNAVLLPLAVLLNGIGYVVIVRWNPANGRSQAEWVALGIILYVGTLLFVRHSRDLDRYRYLLLLIAGILLVAPLFFPPIGGARLWIHFGSFEFQPVEIGKVLLCIFFASYFAENKEMLSIPSSRFGNRLIIDPRPLLPILIAWGVAMMVIGAEDDIGFALLIFTLFIGLLWISTGRVGYLLFGVVLFAIGGVIAAHFFVQFHTRVSIWLNPWTGVNYTNLGGAQLAQGWLNMGTGGIGGTGLGLDPYAWQIPALTTDMIFAAIGTEMGLMGTSIVVIAFVLIVGAGLRIAQTARSDFSKLFATGLTLIIGFQAFFIMAGVTRLLPLTGITLPFVAYGGSSLLANYILIALLTRISDEGMTNAAEELTGISLPGDEPFVTVY